MSQKRSISSRKIFFAGILIISVLFVALPVMATEFVTLPGFKYSYDPMSRTVTPTSPSSPSLPVVTPPNTGGSGGFVTPGTFFTPGSFAYNAGFSSSYSNFNGGYSSTITPTTVPTSHPYDPNVIGKVVQVGMTTIEVNYPRSSAPVVMSSSEKYRWNYAITFTDLTGNGFFLLNRTRYYTSADGSIYTTWGLPVSKEAFEYDISPYESYSDKNWVQSSLSTCTFCGGTVHLVYFGQNNYGLGVEIPVNIYLEYP